MIALPKYAGEARFDGSDLYTVINSEGKATPYLLRISLLDGSQTRVYTGDGLESYEVNNGVVAIGTFSYVGEKWLNTSVLRTDSNGTPPTVLATGRSRLVSEEVMDRAEDRNEGVDCGDYVSPKAITDSGAVMVHRVVGERKGRVCKDARNANTETFTMFGAGSTVELFENVGNLRGDDVLFSGLGISDQWEIQVAGEYALFTSSDLGFTLDISTGERSPDFLTIRRKDRTNTLGFISAILRSDGSVVMTDRVLSGGSRFRSSEWSNVPYLRTLTGEIWSAKRVGAFKGEVESWFCGSRILVNRSDVKEMKPPSSLTLFDQAGEFAATLPKPPTRTISVMHCDESHIVYYVLNLRTFRRSLVIRSLT